MYIVEGWIALAIQGVCGCVLSVMYILYRLIYCVGKQRDWGSVQKST